MRRSEEWGAAAARNLMEGTEPEGRPDSILVREARQGCHTAFGELVARYQDRIYTLVYGHLQNREDALDLTQEVFIRAHGSLGAFREQAVFSTWLYRIALNGCIDLGRRRKRFASPVSLEGDLLAGLGYEPVDHAPHGNPERALLNQELGGLLRQMIQRLPEPLRTALILSDIEGLSQKESAAAMRCPLGTVKSRVQRAREELRAQLHPYLSGLAARTE
jgi:RNA polymerase sigma-70 factor (ECF subfamily)